jgi:hypothetical protein
VIVGEDFRKESNGRVLTEGNIILELQQTSHHRQTSIKRTTSSPWTYKHQTSFQNKTRLGKPSIGRFKILINLSQKPILSRSYAKHISKTPSFQILRKLTFLATVIITENSQTIPNQNKK